MAVQQGIMPFSGRVGELVGFSRNGRMFKKKSPGSYDVSEESKKSGKEFGRGSSAAALVRQAFETLFLPQFKAGLHNRLSERFREVIRRGPLSDKGNRRVVDGDIALLAGFELSSYTRFHKLVTFSPEVSISGNSISVNIPSLSWKDGFTGPAKANRAVLGLVFGFFDFENCSGERLLAGDLVIERDKPFAGASLQIPVPRKDEQVVLVMMTVFFSDTDGERLSRIDNRLYQAGVILAAAHIRDGQLVEFIPEKLPEIVNDPAIKPDVNWRLNTAG